MNIRARDLVGVATLAVVLFLLVAAIVLAARPA